MVSPPEQCGCPVAVSKITVVHDGAGHPRAVFSRMEGFGTGQVSEGILHAPVLLWLDGNPRRPRVNLAGVDVPAEFIRLAPMKARCFNTDGFIRYPDSDYVAGNMG